MSLRLPRAFADDYSSGPSAFEREVLAERAATLASHARAVTKALDALRDQGSEGRDRLVEEAAQRLYSYLVTREVMGFRDSEGVIKSLHVPAEVQARLGAVGPGNGAR